MGNALRFSFMFLLLFQLFSLNGIVTKNAIAEEDCEDGWDCVCYMDCYEWDGDFFCDFWCEYFGYDEYYFEDVWAIEWDEEWDDTWDWEDDYYGDYDYTEDWVLDESDLWEW